MIRGTKRRLAPAEERKLELPATLHNRFDFEVCDASTGEVKQRASAFNTICNALWGRVFNYGTDTTDPSNPYIYWAPQPYFNYVVFGSGTGDVAATDTELFERKGAKQITSSNRTITGDFGSGVVTSQAIVTLQAEEQVGTYLREVGIGYDDTHIVTHALLQDMNGNPISLMKGSTDVVKIYATVYVQFNGDGYYTQTISFASFSNGRESIFAHFCGWPRYNLNQKRMMQRAGAGTRTGAFRGSEDDLIVEPNPGDHSITFSTRFAAGELNIPIRSIPIRVYVNPDQYVHTYVPALWVQPVSRFLNPSTRWYTPPKISAEAIGTGDGTKTGFPSAFPIDASRGGIAVYVNGVEQTSGVTVRGGPADLTAMENWLYELEDVGPFDVYASSAGGITSDGVDVGGLGTGIKSHIFLNPFAGAVGNDGISKLFVHRSNVSGSPSITVMASQNRSAWTNVGTFAIDHNTTEISIPAEYQKYVYWQFVGASGSASYRINFLGDAADNSHNVVFDTAPANGDVITLDYYPACIAKDENHVFDLTVEIQLNRN